MKPKEGNLTLRQRFEAQRQSATTPPQFKLPDDALLRALLGREVTLKFENGDEITAIFTALDRFTIRLGGDLVVSKHAIQTVRLTGGGHRGSAMAGSAVRLVSKDATPLQTA